MPSHARAASRLEQRRAASDYSGLAPQFDVSPYPARLAPKLLEDSGSCATLSPALNDQLRPPHMASHTDRPIARPAPCRTLSDGSARRRNPADGTGSMDDPQTMRDCATNRSERAAEPDPVPTGKHRVAGRRHLDRSEGTWFCRAMREQAPAVTGADVPKAAVPRGRVGRLVVARARRRASTRGCQDRRMSPCAVPGRRGETRDLRHLVPWRNRPNGIFAIGKAQLRSRTQE